MTENTLIKRIETLDPDHINIEQVTSYEDGDRTVICDRKNTQAWIRSDSTVAINV
ncbi:hypothetical protein [Natrinema sp. SYSU A 869]|uniref:DUF7331 family protein n=1 Tax=Natrinema sp. SYSU A 869 TaxID=2871694 RepID=UPI001CA42844|nr:hypothetical protein [Natrinema sp. SYSU A 869]